MKRQFLVQQSINLMGVNQSELAALMGVDKSTVSKWVNGVDHFDDSRVFQLKHYFEKYCPGKKGLFDKVIIDIDRKNLEKVRG